MRRVVIPPELLAHIAQSSPEDDPIDLGADAARYIVRVLRLRPPTTILLIDGRGQHLQASLTETSKDTARVQRSPNPTPLPNVESPLSIHLGIGLPKGERWEFILQKCTELGVSSITPLLTDHSQVHIPPKKLAARLSRWETITLQAVRQSQRLRAPTLHPPTPLQDALKLPQHTDARLFAHLAPHGTPNPLRNLPPPPQSLTVFLGPEGGWSHHEAALLGEHGWTPLPLGPRTLRVETAAVAVCSIAQFLLGDLSHAHSPS